MTSFTFSAEQVKAAPPEVRRWIEAEISRALGMLANSPSGPSEAHESALAICRTDEMAELLKRISGNLLVMRVFFELAREAPSGGASAPLHLFNIGEMLRHAQLTNVNQLFKCFDAINRVLREIRDNAEASVFGFDEAGHIYIHETTYRSIRQVWEQLLLAHSPGALSEPVDALNAAPDGAEPYESAMRPEYAFAGDPEAGPT
jgi:hypothetical protein